MVWLLRKCARCEKYTLNQEKCAHCGGNVHVPHPAKFSPDDKYAKYRVELGSSSKSGKDNHHRKDQD